MALQGRIDQHNPHPRRPAAGDIAGDPTTYYATATRAGKQWTATATDLPDGHIVQAQGASWAEVKSNVAERDAVRQATRLFIAQGWSTRDAGSAMRLSHQRISQIVSAATP